MFHPKGGDLKVAASLADRWRVSLCVHLMPMPVLLRHPCPLPPNFQGLMRLSPKPAYSFQGLCTPRQKACISRRSQVRPEAVFLHIDKPVAANSLKSLKASIIAYLIYTSISHPFTGSNPFTRVQSAQLRQAIY